MSPFVFVEESSFPLRVRLSTSREVRPSISVVVAPRVRVVEPRVIVLFASSAFATPPSLIVTTPFEVAKLSFENEATPFAFVVASLIVTSPEVIVK